MQKHKKEILLLGILTGLIVFIVLGVIYSPDYMLVSSLTLIWLYIFSFGYLLYQKNWMLLKRLIAASVVSFIWMLFGMSQYGYNQNFLVIGGFNMFPLFAWALGLFGVYLLFSYIRNRFKITKPFYGFGVFLLIYWPLLIFGETVGYHLFNIQNVATGQYPGLPICDCMHAPWWMQLTYFMLGPLLFWIYYLLHINRLDPRAARK